MKKIYLTILSALTFGIVNAQSPQISNGGFESWSTTKKATGWTSTNDVLSTFSVVNVYKDSTTKKGNYSVRMKCVSILGTAVPGIITNGTYPTGSLSTSFDPNLIRPIKWIYSERPDSLTGYYKYTRMGNDTGTIGVRFFKNQVLIGEGAFYATASNSGLTRFATEIQWADSQIPDSVYILASTGGKTTNTADSEINIDNLGFAGLTGIKAISSNTVKLVPNPAKNYITLKGLNTQKTEITVYNTLGSEVLKTTTLNGTIDIEKLNPGVYFIEAINDKDKITQRFIKE
jgi:hypothetical protein